MERLYDLISAEIEKEEATAAPETPAPTEPEKPGEEATAESKPEKGEESPEAPPAEGEPKESGGDEAAASDDKTKGEAGATPAKAEDKKAEEPPAAPRLYKVKVDGKEKEVSEDVLIAGFQLKETSYQRLQEAQQMKKDVKAFSARLMSDDMFAAIEDALAANLGTQEQAQRVLFEKAMKWLEPIAARASMSEDERRVHEERERFNRERRSFDGERAKEQARKQAELQHRYFEQLDRDLQVVQKKYNLPLERYEKAILKRIELDRELEIMTTVDEAAADIRRDIDALEAEKKSDLRPTPSYDEWEKQNAEFLKQRDAKKATEKTRPATSIPPFPASTAKNGEAQPKEERAKRPTTYSSQREFHEALLREASR